MPVRFLITEADVEIRAVMTSYCLKVVQSNQSAMNFKKTIGVKTGARRVGEVAVQCVRLMSTGCVEAKKRPASLTERAFCVPGNACIDKIGRLTNARCSVHVVVDGQRAFLLRKGIDRDRAQLFQTAYMGAAATVGGQFTEADFPDAFAQ